MDLNISDKLTTNKLQERQLKIIKGFRTIVFIFIVISTMFRCLSNLEIFTEFQTTSFTESTGVACSDSVSHNRVQVISIPVLYLLAVCVESPTSRRLSPLGTNAYNRYAMCPAGQFRLNFGDL